MEEGITAAGELLLKQQQSQRGRRDHALCSLNDALEHPLLWEAGGRRGSLPLLIDTGLIIQELAPLANFLGRPPLSPTVCCSQVSLCSTSFQDELRLP